MTNLAKRLLFISSILCLSSINSASAYDLLGASWPNKLLEFRVNHHPTYDYAFVDALASWSPHSKLVMACNNQAAATPCLNDGINSYGFSTSLCGNAWGDGILAVTINTYEGSSLVDTDILLNATREWSLHDDPISSVPADFFRVTVHEIGHALGLGHSESTSSVMFQYYHSITKPYPDDINGIRAIYGSVSALSTSRLNCLPPIIESQPSLMSILSMLLLN